MYLVIETKGTGHEFTHFIEINKNTIEKEIINFVDHIKVWNETIKKVYFSKDKLTNW